MLTLKHVPILRPGPPGRPLKLTFAESPFSVSTSDLAAHVGDPSGGGGNAAAAATLLQTPLPSSSSHAGGAPPPGGLPSSPPPSGLPSGGLPPGPPPGTVSAGPSAAAAAQRTPKQIVQQLQQEKLVVQGRADARQWAEAQRQPPTPQVAGAAAVTGMGRHEGAQAAVAPPGQYDAVMEKLAGEGFGLEMLEHHDVPGAPLTVATHYNKRCAGDDARGPCLSQRS